MKILIIGAKGMLGQELVKALSHHEVTAWDMEDIDITKEPDTREKIMILAPDVIINAAAYNAVDRAEEEKEKANLINGYAPGYLAKIANDINAVLVHYSTDYVFAGDKIGGYTEGDEPNPVSAYGASKLLGEAEVQAKTNKYYIIRLSKLFGKMGGGEAVKKSFVDTMLALAKENKEIKSIDEELSSPTYAPDLAEQTKSVIETGIPFGIYHLANSGACTWYEFAKEIFSQAQIDCNLIKVGSEIFKRVALRPRYSILLNTKLPPSRSWKKALRDYIDSIF